MRFGLAFDPPLPPPPQPGDAMYLHGSSVLDTVLQDLEQANEQPSLANGIYPCHVGMCIHDGNGTLSVAEMAWPVCRILPLDKWLTSYGTDQYWTQPLKNPLTTDQSREATALWADRVGNWYDLSDLVQMGLEGGWNALCARLHLPLSCTSNPIELKGVCSVNAAMVYSSLGFTVPTPLRQSPASLVGLPFLGTPRRII